MSEGVLMLGDLPFKRRSTNVAVHPLGILLAHKLRWITHPPNILLPIMQCLLDHELDAQPGRFGSLWRLFDRWCRRSTSLSCSYFRHHELWAQRHFLIKSMVSDVLRKRSRMADPSSDEGISFIAAQVVSWLIPSSHNLINSIYLTRYR